MSDPKPLPVEITESVAIVNKVTSDSRVAILSNLDLANVVFNNNLCQQAMLSQQQAMNNLLLALVAKCVSSISESGNIASSAKEDLEVIKEFFSEMVMLNQKWMDQLKSLTQPSELAGGEK